MSDNTELKTAIEYILNQGALEREFIEDADALDAAWAVYEALGPTDILALIADIEDARNGMKHSCAIRLKKRIELLETQRDQLIADNERLHESDQEATELCDTLSVLLGEIAVAVRGPEEPKSRHGFHDLPSRVKTVVAERDQLKAENERLRADYAGLARFNPEWDRVAAAQDLVREHMAMVVQLKAEIAGLKTGYEAYEQVNAELKAEVEALRRVTGNRYAPPRAPLTGPSKCLSCGEIHYGMGGLPCPNMRITAQADLPETLSGQIGAALGQGEQS